MADGLHNPENDTQDQALEPKGNLLKKIIIAAVAVPVLLAVTFGIYLLLNIQGVIEPFDAGSSNAVNKILIASQGSAFKEELVRKIVGKLKNENNYLAVVDCTMLPEEKIDKWDAFVIIHTTQVKAMQPDAEAFLKRMPDLKKVVMVVTSGAGDWQPAQFAVDAITSASKKEDIEEIAQKVAYRVGRIVE